MYVKEFKYLNDYINFDFYSLVCEFFGFKKNEENKYLTLYIASLANSNMLISKKEDLIISNYIDKLIEAFENIVNCKIRNIEHFKLNLKKHLNSSYYRIKYSFPYKNPILKDIKFKYSYLFYLMKLVIKNIEFNEFKHMSEDEIGFLAMYFGSNIYTKEDYKNKVIIVCPDGTIVSKSLEYQLYEYIPNIEIIGTYSIYDLKQLNEEYDYIISTIELKEYKNVIKVMPVLTNKDISKLAKIFVNIPVSFEERLIKDILDIISENTKIINRYNLEKKLMKLLLSKKIRKEVKPMLKEVLKRKNMQKIEFVKDWKEAIKIAANPLLENGDIEEVYIKNMIKSVEKFGPYIVLDDYFALPHASNVEGVKKLSMSLLYTNNEVELMGKPVKIFVVLATPNKNIHLRALSSLSEIVGDEDNMKVFLSGDLDKIDNLIQKLG